MHGIQTYIDRLIKESTPEYPLWNIETLRQGKKPSWNYIDGCMMSALWQLYITTGDKKYYNFVKDYIDYYTLEDGTIKTYDKNKYNLDDINEGRVLFDLYGATGDEKYKKAIFNLKSQLDSQPRTATGNFWHKQIYPNQVWLDGIYMAQVFYCRYQTAFDGADYEDIVSQLSCVNKYMYDKEKNLYYHGFDCSKKAFWADKNGLSKNFWLRSIGWFLVALADILEYCVDKKACLKISKIFKQAISGIEPYIDKKSHMLYQVVDKGDMPGNYLETSGSLMVAYAMIKGARIGVLDSHYKDTGIMIFNSTCRKYLKIQDDGSLNLGGICLVAGLGPENNRRRDGSFEYYVSEPIVENDAKGVAPLVMCYAEIKRLEKFSN